MKKATIQLYLFGLLTLVSLAELKAQNVLKNKDLDVSVDNNGIIKSFSYNGARGKTDVSFREDPYFKGPALFFNETRLPIDKTTDSNSDKLMFSGKTDSLTYTLDYQLEGNAFVINASVTNRLSKSITNPIVTLRPGINTELDSFPEWNYIFFPTLLRAEKTHFWGYIMNGVGDILSMGTKEPVASWQMEYELPGHWRGKGGHLIFSYRLDLMHKLPLPVRHPQNLTVLKPNETKSWTVYIKPVNTLEEVKPELTKTVGLPMIDAENYTVMEGGAINLDITTIGSATAEIITPSKETKKVDLGEKNEDGYKLSYQPVDGPGAYILQVTDENNYIAEATISVRQNFSWYMNKAREASVRYGQYASSHLENWLGLHSGFLAQKYSKAEDLDKAIEERLNTILKLQWDEETHIPKNMYELRKTANTGQMISVLVDAYEATGKIKYLEKANGLANILMTFQFESGEYTSADGVDYTVIFYPVKSMMELLTAEKELYNDSDPKWKVRYERHYESAKRAIDHLVEKKDNIMTEGQQTFEDGMLSCSATQIAMFAMIQQDPELRKHYTETAILMAGKHKPLEQLIIPDSRMNGGTIRFWEAQYDVLENKKKNFINSPHGWSAWRIYGIWYLYLLTGEETYLEQTMNALGTCVQVIDAKTGTLRWAFVTDPYCEVEMLRINPDTVGVGQYFDTVVGEQYVNMVSDFKYPKTPETIVFGYKRVNGWSCNNDVHEIFKCMEEVSLTSAYIFEREDGSLITWNCTAKMNGGTLEVTPAEDLIEGVHLNLKKEYQTLVHLKSGDKKQKIKGMTWVGKPAFSSDYIIPKDIPVRMVRGLNKVDEE